MARGIAAPLVSAPRRDALLSCRPDNPTKADAKCAAAAEANERGEHVMQYNARKQDVIRQIYARAFRAAGLSV